MSDGVVVLIEEDEEYLMIQDADGPYEGQWAPVHGGVEDKDDSIEDAVVRESREEVGLEVKPVKKIAETDADYGVDRLHWYRADIVSGEIETNEEISSYGYFTVKEVLEDGMGLLPAAERFFNKYSDRL